MALDGKKLLPSTALHQIAAALWEVKPSITHSDSVPSAHYMFDGDMIDKDETIILLGIPAETIAQEKVALYRDFFVNRVKIVIEYCSLYEECETIQYPHS